MKGHGGRFAKSTLKGKKIKGRYFCFISFKFKNLGNTDLMQSFLNGYLDGPESYEEAFSEMIDEAADHKGVSRDDIFPNSFSCFREEQEEDILPAAQEEINDLDIMVNSCRDYLKSEGHTEHCASRILYGDGECECGIKGKLERLEKWKATCEGYYDVDGKLTDVHKVVHEIATGAILEIKKG